jgi:hypothetical protein
MLTPIALNRPAFNQQRVASRFQGRKLSQDELAAGFDETAGGLQQLADSISSKTKIPGSAEAAAKLTHDAGKLRQRAQAVSSQS